MKKNRILNGIMIVAIFLIVLSGVMITGTLKGWFGNEYGENSKTELTVTQEELGKVPIERQGAANSLSNDGSSEGNNDSQENDTSKGNEELQEHKDSQEQSETSSPNISGEIPDTKNSTKEESISKEEKEDISSNTGTETDSTEKAKEKNKEHADTSKTPKSQKNETKQSKTEKNKQEITTSKEPAVDKPKNSLTCTIEIRCDSILDNLEDLKEGKSKYVPSDGRILSKAEVEFSEGETVFDVLKRLCDSNNIQLEYSWTPFYNSYYIEGIHQLYEFDCGSESGWMYQVNGIFPNYGCSSYTLKDGDVIKWCYTCKGLGADIGASMD